MPKSGYVYLMMNKSNAVVYVGVTSNLVQRVNQHKDHEAEGFTTRYNLTKLVYFEFFDSIEEAIAREKQIKGGSRKKKLDLIKSTNPLFNDLSDQL
jgi:putative endonuclease